MHTLSVSALGDALRRKEISSVELTRHFLERISTHDDSLNAFITVTDDIALEEAGRADERRRAGEDNPLLGIPVAHKDIFCTRGVRTSCGSRMLDAFIAPYDATVVERLRASGTVMLGKTNMDEFAMGSSNQTSWYGPVHNPWKLDCVPGGSSGGSAAAVAAGLAPIATGTETGGSIRQPAALTGLTGLKPTYGRVSRFGMVAFASSLDQAGILARSAEDVALALGALAGHDPKDSTSVNRPVDDYPAALRSGLSGVRIGVVKEQFGDGLDAEVGTLVQGRNFSISSGSEPPLWTYRSRTARFPFRCTTLSHRRKHPPTCRDTTAYGSVIVPCIRSTSKTSTSEVEARALAAKSSVVS